MTRSKKAKAETPAKGKEHGLWELRLYVAGSTPKSLAAFANLKRICDEHLTGRYRIEIVDLCLDPQRASADAIVAVPTLIRKLPQPVKKLIGTLKDEEQVLVGMDLRGVA